MALRRRLPVRIPSRGYGLYLSLAPHAVRRAPRLTTTQRDDLTPVDRQRIFNVTTKRFEIYDAGSTSWVDEATAYD